MIYICFAYVSISNFYPFFRISCSLYHFPPDRQQKSPTFHVRDNPVFTVSLRVQFETKQYQKQKFDKLFIFYNNGVLLFCHWDHTLSHFLAVCSTSWVRQQFSYITVQQLTALIFTYLLLNVTGLCTAAFGRVIFVTNCSPDLFHDSLIIVNGLFPCINIPIHIEIQ